MTENNDQNAKATADCAPRTCSADDVDEITKLKARITQLESYMEKTADNKLVCECEKLYCPKCGQEVKQEPWNAYCWNCVNPDDGCWPNEIPLPISYGSCLSSPPNGQALRPGQTETKL